MNPYEKLTSCLTADEYIFIYDGTHNVAVTVVNSDSLAPLYIARAFLPSVSAWAVIDMQNTDRQGAQFMYNCLLRASIKNNVSRETCETEKRKL